MTEVLEIPRPEGNLSLCDDMVLAADAALVATRRLSSYTDNPDPAIRSTAASILAEVTRQAAPDLARGESCREPQNLMLSLGRRFEQRLVTLGTGLGKRLPVPGRGHFRGWTYVGLAITAGAAGLIATGHFLLALGVLTLRGLTMMAADHPTAGAAAPDVRSWLVAQRWAVRRCLAGHMCDALLLLAVAYQLMIRGQAHWAWTVCAVAGIGLSATILRLATWQYGLAMRRLRLERFLRNSGMLLGLAAAGLTQLAGLTAAVAPCLTLAASGVLVYALIEVLRVHWTVGALVDAETGSGADVDAPGVYVMGPTGMQLMPQAI